MRRTGQSESSTWVIALVLAFILAPVGEIISAVHFNETVRTAAKAVPIPAAPTAQPMTAV